MTIDNNDAVKSTPDSVEGLLEEITPSVYDTLKTAVAIRRWEDGVKLSESQLENCLQAIILYENEHVAEDQRIGSMLTGGCKKE